MKCNLYQAYWAEHDKETKL